MTFHKDLPVLAFGDQVAFDKWLAKNHQLPEYYTSPKGIWVRFYKKHTSIPTISISDAVDTAICWGWIDGLINKYDEDSYLVKYTPRGAKSVWSQKNVGKVKRLVAEGRMQPSGLAQVDMAKADGRWAAAYAGQAEMKAPQEFITLLKSDKQAWDFYQTLSKAELYRIHFQIATAVMHETKDRRMQKYFQLMQKQQKP